MMRMVLSFHKQKLCVLIFVNYGFPYSCQRSIYGDENSTMKLIVPTVCFDVCKYKKGETDPNLYRLHYSELLESFTEYTHIFTDGSKDGDKIAAAFICQSFEFSKR